MVDPEEVPNERFFRCKCVCVKFVHRSVPRDFFFNVFQGLRLMRLRIEDENEIDGRLLMGDVLVSGLITPALIIEVFFKTQARHLHNSN